MASKIADVKIKRGQRVRLQSPGGGGWGSPLTRDPVRVARDVRLGYVSPEAARAHYGVIVDTDGTLDEAATRALRKELAA